MYPKACQYKPEALYIEIGKKNTFLYRCVNIHEYELNMYMHSQVAAMNISYCTLHRCSDVLVHMSYIPYLCKLAVAPTYFLWRGEEKQIRHYMFILIK